MRKTLFYRLLHIQMKLSLTNIVKNKQSFSSIRNCLENLSMQKITRVNKLTRENYVNSFIFDCMLVKPSDKLYFFNDLKVVQDIFMLFRSTTRTLYYPKNVLK